MKALKRDGSPVNVDLIGERIVLRNGEPCEYRNLSPEEQNYYDIVADSIYDLPIFEDGYILAIYNVFTAMIPAIVKNE